MKILHLLSNWKWTERSEPAVDLALAERDLGAQVAFVCGRWPEGDENGVAFNAQKKGLDSVVALEMPKHFRVFAAWRDAGRLRRLLADFSPDVIHCHMSNAHIMASMATRRPKGPLIVRNCYDPYGPKSDIRSRILYRRRTDGLIVISQAAKENAMRRYGFGLNAVQVAEPGINLTRFSRERKTSGRREDFGLKKNDFVVGVVSRIRETRRIDVVLDAVRILAEAFPQLRLLLVGRGRKNAVEEVVNEPARRLGIAGKVILPGYCRNDRLVAAYRTMDVLVYPAPGTDKTCRTVREAMASGVPVIATRMGFLPELIEDGLNGRLMDLAPHHLAEILSDMIRDREKVTKMASHAYQTAQQRFSTALQAKKTMSFYERLLGEQPGDPAFSCRKGNSRGRSEALEAHFKQYD